MVQLYHPNCCVKQLPFPTVDFTIIFPPCRFIICLHRLSPMPEPDTFVVKNGTNILSCISLFLTLFGLFGITRYAIEQRKYEINIRKIHGASILQILWLINYPFLSYIGIAFLVIIPITYYFMTGWLQQFAYHITLNIYHFLLPLLFTIGVTLFTVCLNGYRTAITSLHPCSNS